MNKQPGNQGFIKIAVAIVIIVVILGILQIDLRSLIESGGVQSNLDYLRELLVKLWTLILVIWNDYLKTPVMHLWELVLDSLNNRPQ